MPHKHRDKIPKLNERAARYMTWNFTSVLMPMDQVRADINRIVTNDTNVAHSHLLLVKACIKEKVINQARPECVTYISWRFSRADAASWLSNTRDNIPLTDLPFEGYVQSTLESGHVQPFQTWFPEI